MYRTRLDFHNALNKNEEPVSYILIESAYGYRSYGHKELKTLFEGENYIADGSYLADGSIRASGGDLGVIDKAGRLLKMGGINKTINPKKSGLLFGYTNKQQQKLTVDLDNKNDYFSKILPRDPFLSQVLRAYVGYEYLDFFSHVRLFTGKIAEINVTPDKVTLTAEEQ